jgi:hypothetical protein
VKPPERKKTEYERVTIGDFITGIIEDIEYDMEHQSSFKNPDGTPKITPSVRFKFKLDGYSYPHRSRWMSFSYGEKANLYNKYLAKLVPGAMPDMDYDLDTLKGMKVKTLWAEEKGKDGQIYQHIENIFPIAKTHTPKPFPPVRKDEPPLEAPDDTPVDNEDVPF